MSNYPASKQSLVTNINPDDLMSGHAELHNKVNDTVNDLQDFVGYHDNQEGTTIVASIKTLSDDVVEVQEKLTGIESEVPSQENNGGKFLYTDGTKASWEEIAAQDVDVSGLLPKGDGLKAPDAAALEKLIEENKHNIANVEKAVQPFVDENLTWRYLAEKSGAINA